MSSLPASIKRIGSKATQKRWRHHFPHYKSMGAFCCHGNQCFDPICPKTFCSLSPTPVMLHIKFDQDWLTGFRDIQVWKCGRRRRRRTTGILKAHLVSLRLRWAKKQILTSSHFKRHINGPWKPVARNRTHPSFYACPGYQQLLWWSDQKWMS